MTTLQPGNVAQYFSPRRLRLVLMPTEKCNFRCAYCYENFEVGRMPADIQEGVINLLESRGPDLDVLDIDWFGGEPLMASDVMLDLGGKIDRICRENGVVLRASATTNGYYLDRYITAALVERQIRAFQVSVDGPPNTHDRRRPHINGQGTYTRIAENIVSLLGSDLDFRLVLRVHYDPITFDDVCKTVEETIAPWARDPRVSVVFAHIENLASDLSVHVPQFQPDESAEALRTLRSFVPTALSKEDSVGVCYAAQPNAFVVRANGRLAKCTVALNDPRNDIGALTPDGRLLLNGGRLAPWHEGWRSGNIDQLACPLNYLAAEAISALQAAT
jgi:uncharacterized protein